MLPVFTFGFYSLGRQLEQVRRVVEGDAYRDVWVSLYFARGEVAALLENTIVPVRTCRNVALELKAAITAIVPEDFSEAGKQDQSATISSVQAWKLSAYSTAELIGSAEMILPEAIRSKLAPEVIAEVRQAGRCYAFETTTAAGFHIFRAIEAVMLSYCQSVTGKPMPTRARNWGVYIKQMRESGKADAKVVELLDHIRDKYRNPVSHPDETYTLDDVQVLLGLAASVIVQMVRTAPPAKLPDVAPLSGDAKPGV